MNGLKALSLAAAALLLAASVTVAQTATDEAREPQATKTEPGSTTTDRAAKKPAGNDQSPSDYRASEKISEDLPVSFPVDI